MGAWFCFRMLIVSHRNLLPKIRPEFYASRSFQRPLAALLVRIASPFSHLQRRNGDLVPDDGRQNSDNETGGWPVVVKLNMYATRAFVSVARHR
jgi:hypothetical protein